MHRVFKDVITKNPLKTINNGNKKGVKIGSLKILFRRKSSKTETDQTYNSLRNMVVKEKNIKWIAFSQNKSRKSS